MNKKVLILYAKSGFLGHKVIADNYACLLKKLGYEVHISDVFEIDHSNQIEIGNRAYFLLLQKASWLWRFLYFYWPHIPGINWARTSLFPRRLKKTQRLIINHRADLIITTHPVATGVVNYLKAKERITADLFTTFSDWHTQRFWIFPHVNKFLVPTFQHKTDLIKLGFNADQVEVTGMLLAEDFYNVLSKQEARNRLNLPQDAKVILVMGGGKGWGIEELISSLDQLRTEAYIIIVGGSDERKSQIEKRIWRHSERPSKFIVTSFIDPAPYFAAADLLVSKPGGLTTSQAFLLRLPILPVLPLPGQEDENMRILKNSNSILVADKDVDLAGNIDGFLSNQKKLDQVTASAFQLVPAQTPQAISQILMSTKSP